MKIQVIKYLDFGLNLAEQLGGSAANGILGEGMGLLFANANRNQQLETQQGLTDIAVKGQEQLAGNQLQNQEALWNYTNYGNQVQQANQAGLNPALLYAKGGMGGATGAGTPGLSAASAGQAPNAGTATQQGLGITPLTTAQLNLMDAQKKNIDADTANKQSENPNIPKTGANIDADTANKQANTALTKLQTGIAGFDKAIKEATMPDLIKTIDLQAQNLQQQVFQNVDLTKVTDATVQTKINQAKTELTNSMVQTAVMKSQIQLNQATIQSIVESIDQKWDSIDIDQQKADFDEQLAHSQSGLMDKEKEMLLWQTISGGAAAIGNLFKSITGGQKDLLTTPKIPNQIKGFQK